MNRSKGMADVVLSAVLFGITPVLATVTYGMGSNAATLTFYRNLMVVPPLFIFMLIRGMPLKITKKQLGLLLLMGVCFRAVATFTLYASYDYMGIGGATTLHFLYPVFTALICRIGFGERMGRIKIIALALATGGVAFFSGGASAGSLTGIALAVGSGLAYALYMVGVDKTELREMNSVKMACYMGLLNSAAMLVFDLPVGDIVFALPPLALLYTFIIAMCTSFLAVALLQKGIKYLGACVAAIFSTFEPIICVLAGWGLLDEKMTAPKAAGCAAVLAAVCLVALSGRERGGRNETA